MIIIYPRIEISYKFKYPKYIILLDYYIHVLLFPTHIIKLIIFCIFFTLADEEMCH